MTSQLPDVVKIICFAKKDSDGSTEALPAQDPLELQDWEQEQEPEPVTDPLIGAEPEQIGLEPELDSDPFQLDQAADDGWSRRPDRRRWSGRGCVCHGFPSLRLR